MTTRDVEELIDPTSPFDAAGKYVLARINKFLVNIADKKRSAIAQKHGYTNEEHQEGWRLYKEASGADRPLSHFVAAQEKAIAAKNEKLLAGIRSIDAFENIWFPRTRSALERFVSEAEREAVVGGFFKDLQQQPEGIEVLVSVGTFVGRFKELRQSTSPGVVKAVEALRMRGLTDDLIQETEALLASTRELGAPASPTDDAEQRAAAARQIAGFDAAKRWFRDWRTTLETEFGYHDLVKLGLRERKGGRATKDEGDEV